MLEVTLKTIVASQGHKSPALLVIGGIRQRTRSAVNCSQRVLMSPIIGAFQRFSSVAKKTALMFAITFRRSECAQRFELRNSKHPRSEVGPQNLLCQSGQYALLAAANFVLLDKIEQNLFTKVSSKALKPAKF